MSENIDYSKRADTKRLKHAFVPTFAEVMVLLLLSAVFLVGINMYSYLRAVDTENYVQATDSIKTSIRSGLSVIDDLLGPTIPLIIFWMIVGLVVYIIAWFSYRAYVAYKNDMPIKGNMIKPVGYNEQKNTQEALIRLSIRVVSFFLLIYWLYMYLTEVLSFASNTFLNSITEIGWASILGIILSIITLAINTFIIFVLARCVVMRERVFTK